MSKRHVRRWTPGLVDSLKLAAKPAAVFLVFNVIAFVAFFITLASYEGRGKEIVEMFIACGAGIVGVMAGQLVSIFRFRALPVFIAGAISVAFAIYVIAASRVLPKEIVPAVFFFCFAFPCGMLSLQHRWELFAAFWPSVGLIGSVFVILNHEGRVHQWEQDKLSAWLPVPLLCLGIFLVLLLLYLASKQALRVQLWQALSGSAARRIDKRAAVTALPRKNLLPLLGAAVILFGATAVLAPYLWRTGKGDRKGKHGKQTQEEGDGDGERRRGRRGPQLDEEAIAQRMKQMAQGAKKAAQTLWPLLFLLLLYRPAKRGLLSTHLKTPIFPTPPSERIDNLWEYVRIAAEDAGVTPVAADSVEDLCKRMWDKGLGGPELEASAAIYVRSRYGFVIAAGDANEMRKRALGAAKELRKDMTTWDRVRSWWRPLS